MNIDQSCDLCGSDEKLTPESYRRWGRTLGRRLPSGAKFVVGGVVAPSTPARMEALIVGLTEAGMQVVDLGMLPVPMVDYAYRRLRAEGCAVVTNGHDSAQHGLRWMLGDELPTPKEHERLRCEASKLSRPRRKRGDSRSLDISFDYVAWLQQTWVDSLAVQRRIVLDPRHGCLAAKARRYLQAVFPHCLFWAIHDGPESEPGCCEASGAGREPLRALADAVYHERADLGIAFDAGGERVAFVDEEGTTLSAEETAWVLLESFGEEAAGAPFVHDLHFSRRLPEMARRLNAQPLAERSGPAFLHRRMRQSGAVFGAQTGGRYFFRALEGGHDGLFAACWLIAWLGHCGRPLSELRRQCPPVFITPELRVSLESRRHRAALKRLSDAWASHPQSDLDGVRIEFPDGWALAQSHAPQPRLSFRFEADDWHSLEQLVWRFCEPLDDLGDRLWMQYTALMGTQE